MTINDPNRRRTAAADRSQNWPMWIAGALALMLVVGFLIYGMNDRNTNTAATNRGPVTETRTTTGSGATTPAVNTPAAQTNPAPLNEKPPATNR